MNLKGIGEGKTATETPKIKKNRTVGLKCEEKLTEQCGKNPDGPQVLSSANLEVNTELNFEIGRVSRTFSST